MAQVEVGLAAVVEHVDFAVLIGAHRAGIDVDVRIELLHPHAQAAAFQQHADTGAGQPFAERTDDAAGDENVFGHGMIHCFRIIVRPATATNIERSGSRSVNRATKITRSSFKAVSERGTGRTGSFLLRGLRKNEPVPDGFETASRNTDFGCTYFLSESATGSATTLIWSGSSTLISYFIGESLSF